MHEGGGRARTGRGLVALGLLLAGLAAWQFGQGAWIHAKARLAQALIADAWAATVETGTAPRPWPWADTVPVARLVVPALGVDQIVLAGATGRTLAFGPGHLDGSVPPGAPGLSVVSGHRDTHFRFLRDLEPGMEIRLQRADGRWLSFTVGTGRIVDARTSRISATPGGTPRLALATCYPFDAIRPGGPLRYLVFAEASAGT